MSRASTFALRLGCRLVPAGLLLWAGLAKAFDRQESILAVDAYDVLPEPGVRLVAALLPWVEVGVAILLIAGLFVRFAGLATAALGVMFIAAMGQAKARGLEIDCGCFGGGGPGQGVSWWDIVRDVPIVLFGVYLAVRPRGPWQLDNLYPPTEADEEQGGGADRPAEQARAAAGRG
ncbi:MAG TPA: MauE/DoxX family redox-associated membrane protein [Actinomycetota bacterium]|nr:MauE/DoxX family redox-associated membrane protein [Actinomycetota bacterium]